MLFKKKNANQQNQEDSKENKRIEYIVEDLINLLKSLEKGDFTAKPKYPEAFSGKEKPIMDYALGMIRNLTRLIKNICYGFAQIKVGMEQINKATEELANSSQECSQQVSLIDKHCEEIANGIEETADQTQGIANTCEVVGKEIETVTIDIREFGELMRQIYESANRLETVVGNIQGISRETNLLSLNAQIEAARAGEAGKSFAVIASNLSDLNEKAEQEAKESEKIVRNIIAPIKRAEKRVELILGQSTTIMVEAKAIVGKTTKIAQTIQNQSIIAEQIACSIHSIRELMENNAAATEESAASNQEVLAKMEELQNMLDVFKV